MGPAWATRNGFASEEQRVKGLRSMPVSWKLVPAAIMVRPQLGSPGGVFAFSLGPLLSKAHDSAESVRNF